MTRGTAGFWGANKRACPNRLTWIPDSKEKARIARHDVPTQNAEIEGRRHYKEDIDIPTSWQTMIPLADQTNPLIKNA